jgi:hypothetical protein
MLLLLLLLARLLALFSRVEHTHKNRILRIMRGELQSFFSREAAASVYNF